jgi:hypothetical protein
MSPPRCRGPSGSGMPMSRPAGRRRRRSGSATCSSARGRLRDLLESDQTRPSCSSSSPAGDLEAVSRVRGPDGARADVGVEAGPRPLLPGDDLGLEDQLGTPDGALVPEEGAVHPASEGAVVDELPPDERGIGPDEDDHLPWADELGRVGMGGSLLRGVVAKIEASSERIAPMRDRPEIIEEETGHRGQCIVCESLEFRREP